MRWTISYFILLPLYSSGKGYPHDVSKSLHLAQAAEVAATMQQSPHEIGSVARAAAKASSSRGPCGLINKTKSSIEL